MSEDDVLFGYRLRVLDHAARTSVSEACRVFGIHRSTYYVWKRRVERHGLEILRPIDFEVSDPTHLSVAVGTVQAIEGVYDVRRVMPGGENAQG